MKKKTVVFAALGVAGFLMIFIISALVLFVRNLPDFSPVYGAAEITVGGRQLYFKREARGLNYDSVILSPNSNYCDEYNPRTDYRFTAANPLIYYKIDSDTLHLLTGNPTQPEYEYNPDEYIEASQDFPVKVVRVKPDKLIIWEIRQELYRDRGMELLEIPLDESLKCNFK